jgi:hypothetical protein
VQLQTDDDVYRVDAEWLGPPKLTFPWRARYVSYALGLLVLVAVMAVQRRLGIPFGVLSTVWALVVTVVVVRFVGRRVDDERPLGHLIGSWWADVRTPRPPRGPR